MKRLLLLIFSLLCGASVWAGEIPAVKAVKVNARIHALLGPMELPNAKNQGYMVNSTLILGDTGAILIDTGFTDEIGAHLAKAAARITGKPVKVIINTHHHGDHSFGNAAFPGAKVISSEMCRKLLLEGEADWLALVQGVTGRKFPNTRAVPATEVYPAKTRTEVTIDGVKLAFIVPEWAHTAGDMMVWLPDDKVLVGGDILVNQVTPNFRDANVKKWIETLAEVKAMPAKTIIPGHGPLMSAADAARLHERMARLYAGIEAGYKAGLSDSDIRKKLDLSEWKPLHHFEEQMGGNINKAYLEIEAAAF
ncbi:MAG: MBL fold metallo-hydrolase [Betaproteobacteria bacterium]|nr:MBL fold metallo-hydrolase [Betaproteobacteria bacterium]